jgi:ArsR family transcriptional regulator, arsenate/arsenite/antimonite-responsive transcriptional repressor
MNDGATCIEPLRARAFGPGDAAGFERLARSGKALGHPTRVRIMAILLGGTSCTCGEIVDLLPLSQATVSQHLKVLKDAGLIRGEIDGPRVCYRADADALRDHGDLISALIDHALTHAVAGAS